MSNSRLQKLVEMLKENPSDTFALYGIAMEFMGENEIEKAKHYFEEVIKIDDKNVGAYYQLGKIYEIMNDEPAAISIYEKGLDHARKKNDMRSVREFNAAIDSLL